MSKEIQELTIELEFENEEKYELHYEEEAVKIYKKTDTDEEEVGNDGSVFNARFIEQLAVTSDMTAEKISEKVVAVLGCDSFIEADVEVVFADGTEVEFKIVNDDDEDEDEE